MFSIVDREVFSEVPYVVIAIVVSDPGEYFKECLKAAVKQTYENTSILVLDTGIKSVASIVAEFAPDAYYKKLPVGMGYAKAANKVLHSVQGATHLFFIHDDTVLEANVTKLLLEGSYMHNCGIAGPKVLDLEDPNKFLSVGYLTDRFMVPVSISEPEEIDQGQYDQVREVMAVDGAAMLIRSDLFKTVKGFDSSLALFAEDVDICLRAKATGATVYVLPEAKVYHMAAASKQMRQVTISGFRNGFEALRYGEIKTLLGVYSLPRAMWLFFLLICLSLVEIAGSYLVKKTSRAGSVSRVLLLVLSSFGTIVKNRKEISGYKTVSDRQLTALQIKSIGRLRRMVEARDKGRGLQLDRSSRRTIGVVLLLIIVFLLAVRGSLLYGFIFTNRYVMLPPSELIDGFFIVGKHGGLNSVVAPGNLLLGILGTIFFNSTSVALLTVMLFLVYLTFKNIMSLVELMLDGSTVKSSTRMAIILVIALALPFFIPAFNNGDLGFLVISATVPWIIFKVLNGSNISRSNVIGLIIAVYLGTGFELYLPIVLIFVGIVLFIYGAMVPSTSFYRNPDTDILGGAFKTRSKRYFLIVIIPSVTALGLSAPWSLYAYQGILGNRIFNSLDSSFPLHDLLAGGIAGYVLIVAVAFSLISMVFMNGKILVMTSLGFILLTVTLIIKVVCERGYLNSLPTNILDAIVYTALCLIFMGVVEVFTTELSSRKFSWFHAVVVIAVLAVAALFVVSFPQLLSGNSDIPVGTVNELPSTVLNSASDVLYVNARSGGYNSNASQVSYKFDMTAGFKVYKGAESFESLQGLNNSMSQQIDIILNEVSQNDINDAGVRFDSLKIGWVIVELPNHLVSNSVNNLTLGLKSQRDMQSYNSGTANLLIFKNLEPIASTVQLRYTTSNYKIGSINIVAITYAMPIILIILAIIGLFELLHKNYIKVDITESEMDES